MHFDGRTPRSSNNQLDCCYTLLPGGLREAHAPEWSAELPLARKSEDFLLRVECSRTGRDGMVGSKSKSKDLQKKPAIGIRPARSLCLSSSVPEAQRAAGTQLHYFVVSPFPAAPPRAWDTPIVGSSRLKLRSTRQLSYRPSLQSEGSPSVVILGFSGNGAPVNPTSVRFVAVTPPNLHGSSTACRVAFCEVKTSFLASHFPE